MAEQKQLSKSDFLSYLECPYQFYYFCTHPNEKQEASESDQLTIENGMEFQDTVNALLDDTYSQEVIFKTNKYYSRTDCVRYIDKSTVELYEIKSSKFKEGEKIDDKYIFDIAFQKFVAEEAGFVVSDSYLILASDNYVFDGIEIKPELFEIVNVNENIKLIEEEIRIQAEMAYKIKCELEKPKEKHECRLKANCGYLLQKVDWPEYHIGSLPRISKGKFWSMFDNGILDIKDITDLSILTKGQKPYYESYVNERLIIKETKIKELLNTLIFPLYFLDYETYAPGVPFIKDYGIYEKIPFQFSLHILDSPNSDLRHEEFLLEDLSRQEVLINELKNHIKETGNIIAWNKSFEASCNDILAQKFPYYKRFLSVLNERLFDLEDFFKFNYYVDYRFKGKSSIKYVLPVLVPEMKYENLAINEGQLASYRWKKAFVDEHPKYPKDKTRKELLEYCEQDSLAMVKIYEFLKSKV